MKYSQQIRKYSLQFISVPYIVGSLGTYRNLLGKTKT